MVKHGRLFGCARLRDREDRAIKKRTTAHAYDDGHGNVLSTVAMDQLCLDRRIIVEVEDEF
jgi:hypothetical protein